MVTNKRKAISVRKRFDIFKRDGFACQYCGAHPPDALLEVDHIVPVAEGGGNDEDNLVTACWPCNRGKAANALTDVPVSLADRAKEIAEREAQLRGYQEVMEARRQRIDDEIWRVADVFMRHYRKESIRKDYLQSIKHFVERLGVHEVLDAMELAVARKPFYESGSFKYFCGICWNKIKGPKDA